MLSIQDVTYRLGDRLLLDSASLTVRDGARIGLVGRNGTGKSTLFRMILGEIGAEQGRIDLRRDARIGTVAQEAPGGPQTLIDFVLDADTERASLLAEAETATDPARIADIQTRLVDIDAASAPARAARILAGLGFDEDAQSRTLETYSGGWRMRVALAAILFAEPDLLLLDEPTNYLDLEGALWLESYLGRYPHTLIVISHDRDLLNTATTEIAHLHARTLTLYRGGYDSFERQRAEKLALTAKLQKKQDAQRKHMEAFVERFRYKASKARQAQSRLKALERMAPVAAIEGETEARIDLPDPERPLSPPIIHISKGAVGYAPGAPVLRELDIRIDHDDRIGLLGANGNGKSTFAKLLNGGLTLETGNMVVAEKLRVGFFAQHQLDELVPEQSPVEHVRKLMGDTGEAKVRARVAQMGFTIEKADTKAAKLSGGEKARLMLGLAAFHKPHLLILDEPTNHLDMDARDALVTALNAYSGAVIVISHDRHLIETTCDRLWLVADGAVRPYEGDIDSYRREVTGVGPKSKSARKAEKPAVTDHTTDLDSKAGSSGQSTAARLKALEAQMNKLHAGIEKLDVSLSDPTLFAKTPARGVELSKLRADAEKLLAKVEQEWLDLSERLEA
ncbi:MAG: ABC-F family ATP-binding cassette domain-containing protein [Pseudomonadota bacterium]